MDPTSTKRPDPLKRWLAFLINHCEAIATMDFFTVPTLTFGVLYCFFVIGHERRKILHFHVTRNPHALWVVQQLREAWAYTQPHRFLLFDRDAKFGAEVVSAVKDMGSKPTRTAFRCPWQNGVAERWVGSCRRDLLDHVIIFSLCGGSVNSRAILLTEDQTLFCNPAEAWFTFSAEESAGNKKNRRVYTSRWMAPCGRVLPGRCSNAVTQNAFRSGLVRGGPRVFFLHYR